MPVTKINLGRHDGVNALMIGYGDIMFAVCKHEGEPEGEVCVMGWSVKARPVGELDESAYGKLTDDMPRPSIYISFNDNIAAIDVLIEKLQEAKKLIQDKCES